MATHFSILVQKILWTEEPGRLQSWDHKKSDNTTEHTHTPTGKLIWERCNQVVKWTRKGSTLTLIFKHLSSLCTSCVFMCVYVYVPISCKNYGPEMLPK